MADTGQQLIPVVEVYWRPGCQFCFRLRQALIRARLPVAWRNIWTNPQHAAFVRSVADNNETVPTAVVNGNAHVNPAPRELLAMISQSHPDLQRLPSSLAAWRAFRRNRAS